MRKNLVTFLWGKERHPPWLDSWLLTGRPLVTAIQHNKEKVSGTLRTGYCPNIKPYTWMDVNGNNWNFTEAWPMAAKRSLLTERVSTTLVKFRLSSSIVSSSLYMIVNEALLVPKATISRISCPRHARLLPIWLYQDYKMAHLWVDYQPEVRIYLSINSLAIFGIKLNYLGGTGSWDSIVGLME